MQQLFGEDSLSTDDKQQSLKYLRPKANDLKNQDVAPTANSSNNPSITLMAKVVTAYRQGELQGKVGLALIQNADSTYNIIMYKTKEHILTTLKLKPGEDLLYKQTKFWQFYDEQATYWSFSFDSTKDENDFMDYLNIKSITFQENRERDKSLENHFDLQKFKSKAQSLETEQDFFIKTSTGATKESKNSLINRMAKMGKPLPTLLTSNQQTTTEFSDSSDTEVIKTPMISSQKPAIAPRSNKFSNIKTNQLVPSMTGINSATTTVYPINPLESQYMQMLLTEQRTQGSELRMNMNKLENKIEKVLDKLDLYGRHDGKPKTEKDDEILELEEKLVMLKKENRKLKQSLQECYAKEADANKLEDVMLNFKKNLRSFNIDYKQDLNTILKELIEKLNKDHNKTSEMEQQLEKIQLNKKEIERKLELETSKNLELQKENSCYKLQANELKLQLNDKEIQIEKQKQEILDLQLQLKPQQSITNDGIVKDIMNNLYVNIADNLDNTNLPQTEQILALIANSIKQQTLKSLQQSKKKDTN